MIETPLPIKPPPALSELAREIAARIGEQRRRLQRVALSTGLLMALVSLCVWLVSETVTDFVVNLPWFARFLFFLAGVGGAGFVLWWFGLRPWSRRVDDETIALMIERALPAFRSRFIAAVQLAKSPEASHSPALVKALVGETTAMAATMDFHGVVDTRKLRQWGKGAAWAVVLAVGLAVAGNVRTWPLVRRALLGTNAVPRKTLLLEINAPRIIAIGDDWHITVTAGGIVPDHGRLIVKTASGRQQTYELPVEGASPTFGYELRSVQEPFSVVVALGDAESDRIAVRVKPRPSVAAVECRQIFPAYTHVPARQRALGDLKILAGSKLALKVKTNAAVQKGEIRLLGSEREKVVKSVPLAFEDKSKVQLAGEIEVPAEGVNGLTLHLVDEEGVESRSAAVYPLEIVRDQSPTIKILWPERREELLTREATLLLSFEAKDDFGVAKVKLHYAVDWVEGNPHKTVELDLGGVSSKDVTRRFQWKVGQIVPHVEEGSVIDYWLEAQDANDISGPGIGTLDHYQARIVSEAEKRADLANRLSDTMEGLNGVRQGQEDLNRRLGEVIFAKPGDTK